MQTLTHNHYQGSIEHSPQDGCLHGKILFIEDLVTYESETVPGLKQEFEAAVDDYLETCAQVGKEPDRPFTGTFQIRVPPELHRQAAMEAKISEQSLNEWVNQAIELRLLSETAHNSESNPLYPESTSEMLRLLREAKAEAYGQPLVSLEEVKKVLS